MRGSIFGTTDSILVARSKGFSPLSRLCSTKLCIASLVTFVLIVAPYCDGAEQGSAGPESKSAQQARSLVVSALNAMGGRQAWAALADTTVSGECQETDFNNQPQGAEVPLRWITKGFEFRYENGTPDALTLMLSGHGRPKAILPSETRQLTYDDGRFDRPFYMPALVLEAELGDAAYRFEDVGEETLNGVATEHIRIAHYWNHSRDLGSVQEWWIVSTSYMPERVTFRLPGEAVQSAFPVTYTFSQWSSNGGLVNPAQIAILAPDAQVSQICSISEIQINTQPADAVFDAR